MYLDNSRIFASLGIEGKVPNGIETILTQIAHLLPSKPLSQMPNKPLPKREELVMLSEHLKRRLLSSAAGRNRKGSNLNADLREELVAALDSLAELAALEASMDSKESTTASKQTSDKSNSQNRSAVAQTAATDADSTSLPAIGDFAVLTETSTTNGLANLVSSSVQQSLDRWQQQITESIVKTLAAQTLSEDAVQLRTLVNELQGELCDTRFQLQAANNQLAEYQAELKFLHEQFEKVELSLFESDPRCKISDGSEPPDVPSIEQLEKLEQLQLQLDESAADVAKLREQNEELVLLLEELTHSTEANQDAPDNSAQQDQLQATIGDLESELSDVRFQLQAANSQLAEFQAELKFYHEQSELGEPKIFNFDAPPQQPTPNVSAEELEELAQLGELRQQLQSALAETEDLRQQNSDLAARLAQQLTSAATSDKPTGRGSGEQLSWEQRKLLILKQLEDDSISGNEFIPHEEKLSIQEVLDSTQAEITRRDEEIEELREIVRMQSEARDGLAIGAAGVAQMLDGDELIQQERQKLREIQEEWESKLRQAEIDLSMERAKIARERIALDKQKEELSQYTKEVVMPACTGKGKGKERRWLSILGLGEQATDQSTD